MMDIQRLKKAAEVAQWAYDQPPHVTVVDVGTATAIIAREKDITWVSFKGTEHSWVDWGKNFWVTIRDYCGLKVHSGCRSEAKALVPRILDYLQGDDNPVIVVGHSQGGGVAPLAAMSLHNCGKDVIAGYGFAPMRSLSKESAGYFNNIFHSWYRIAVENDPVPHLPPAIRYASAGKDIFLKLDGTVTGKITHPVVYLGKLIGMILNKEIMNAAENHGMEHYKELIDAL